MVNGKPGDHPVNDILDHGMAVFSEEADAILREIAQLVPRYRLWDLVDWFHPGSIQEFTAKLRRIRNALLKESRDRGWEV